MRRTATRLAVAGAIATGALGVSAAPSIAAPASAPGTVVVADGDNTVHHDNSGKWGLAGLVGLAGLAGLARAGKAVHDRRDQRDEPRSGATASSSTRSH